MSDSNVTALPVRLSTGRNLRAGEDGRIITSRADSRCRLLLLHSGEFACRVRHESSVGSPSDTISVYPVFVTPCDGLIRPANCL